MSRKFLTTCKNWVRRAAMLSAMIGIMGAVSCSDDYDDSGLRESISNLESRVDALEARLTSEIEALQKMISGKITVISCVTENDVYTVTLSDGTVITVDKSGKQSETDYPVITYVEEDGVLYWAVVRDGRTEALLNADGEKVPVTIVPRVRIETSTREYQISIDGGATWTGTGVYAQDQTEVVTLFTDVDQDDDYVYLTLTDGTVLKVLKSKDLYCTPLAGKQYFTAGETKTVKLALSGIQKMTVNKPDGWRASVVGEALSITAPAEENPYAETEGTVAVVAVGSNGQSTISEVAVAVGTAPVTISVDASMTVSFKLNPELESDWNFMGYYYGVWRLDEFTPEAVITYLTTNTRLNPQYYSVSEQIKDILGVEPEPGVSYVVWAIPAVYTYGGEEYNPSDLIYEIVASVNVTFEEVSKNFEDATIRVTVDGCDKYYAGVVQKEEYDPEYILEDISYGWSTLVSGNYEGLLSKFAVEWGSNTIKSGCTYVVYVVAYESGKSYSLSDFWCFEIEIPAVVSGGSASVAFSDITADMTSVSVTATAVGNAYKSYVTYLSEENYAVYASDDATLREYLLSRGISFTESYNYRSSGLMPDSKGYFVAVAIDADGKAGATVSQEVVTKGIVYRDDISVSVDPVDIGLTSVKLKLTPNGDIVTYRCLNYTESGWKNHYLFNGSESATESALVLRSSYEIYQYNVTDLEDGVLQLDYLTTGASYVFFVLGLDSEGNASHMTRYNYVPELDIEFVRDYTDEWINSTARPTISNIKVDGMDPDELNDSDRAGFHVLTFTVTPGSDCELYYVLATDPEYLPNDYFGSSSYVMANGKEYSDTQDVTAYYFVLDQPDSGITGNRIFLVWKDTAGKYYQVETINPVP